MARDLKNLIRLHEWTVDEKRRVLGEKLRAVSELEARAEALEAELLEEQRIASENPEQAALYYGGYANTVIERREQLATAIIAAERIAAEAREDLNEAYRDLKKYEVVQENRDKAEAEERARKEQAILDELGLEAHRRKNA